MAALDNKLKPYLTITLICLACSAMAGIAVALLASGLANQILGGTILVFSLASMAAVRLALKLPAPEPVKVKVQVPTQISIQPYLDGLERLLAGDASQLVSAPKELAKAERDQLNAITATIRRAMNDRQSLQATVSRLQTKQPIAIPNPVVNDTPPPIQQGQALAKLSAQLEKLASQLLAATDSSEDNRDNTNEQLAALKLQARKLSDRTRALGDTVELLKDLAEQSGVLALNAAIQASRSGESGLAVVADELQRVANRHTDASRQFEESLLQLNNELVETNDMIDNGRQLLGKGHHDLSQLRSHIGTLARTCSELKTRTVQSATAMAEDRAENE